MNLLPLLTLYLALFLGLIASVYVGSAIGGENYTILVISALLLIGLAWAVTARDRWWLPMSIALGLGGTFYVPFKLYPNELAMVVCAVGLLPQIAFKPLGLRKPRRTLPPEYFVLGLFLLGHFAVSGWFNSGADGTGFYNIARAYSLGLWPFFFGAAFYFYASSDNLGQAFKLYYFALIFRLCLGIIAFLIDDTLIIPGLNYALEQYDLRFSGPALFVLAVLLAMRAPSPISRFGHVCIALLAVVATFGGGGRAMTAYLLFSPIMLAIVFRRWIFVIVGVTLLGIVTAAVNASPESLENLPPRVQRALSFLILTERAVIQIQDEVSGSNAFHARLNQEGYTRWTNDTQTLIFGTGVRPYDEGMLLNASRFEVDPFSLMVKVAADVGSYENSFWTVLAVTGALGMFLFGLFLLRALWRSMVAIKRYQLSRFELVAVAWSGFQVVSWLFFQGLLGHFPSQEVFLCVVAMAVLADHEREHGYEEQATEKPAPSADSGRRTTPRGLVEVGPRGAA